MKQLLLICSIFLLTSAISYSQVTRQWASTFNGPGSRGDFSNDIALDAQGNIYVTGYSLNAENTKTDIATVKYNSAGVKQWSAIYNGPNDSDDYAYNLAVDAAGNVYVSGESWGSGSKFDFIVIKYNTSGAEQWVKRLNGSANGNNLAADIILDNQGNILVTGYLANSSTSYDYTTIKYDPAGTELWRKTYNGPGSVDEAKFVTVDGSNNVYVTGESGYGPGNTSPDYLTIKYDPAGVEQWVARTGISYHIEEVVGIAVDTQGNVFVTGTDTRGNDSISYLTVKYNSAGVQQWSKKFFGEDAQSDQAGDIGVDASGNVYVTGASRHSGQSTNVGTVKYTSNGDLEWAAYYTGYVVNDPDSHQEPYDLEIDGSGNVYVTGYDNTLAFTLKYNPAGIQKWLTVYSPTTGDDVFYGMALDAGNNVYVTGLTYVGSTNSFDYVTIKYSQTVGIQNISSEIPSKYELGQNYPNPFNPSTKIEFALPNADKVRLAVYNSIGQEVAILVNEQLNAGKFSYDWNAGALPSGVFFYKLETESFTETKKMLLIK